MAGRHVVQVIVLLVLLEALTFWGYFSGLTVPPWDFLGSYLTEAHAWWDRSLPFAPVQWMSYAWMGFPAAASIQNSSYYLPVGLASLIGPYTPWVAAVVSALHAAFGALGMYVLVRRLLSNHPAALLGLVAYFYTPGFYANAEHVDIVRGFAWTPWILLLFSPMWPWSRRWAIPVGALTLWQFLVGSYPGILVMAAYCLSIWAVTWLLLQPRTRVWIHRLALVGVSGLLLTLLKFGPLLSFGVGKSDVTEQAVEVPLSILATLFFDYGNPALPYDISMRSFFVVSPILLLLPWAPWGDRQLRPVLTVGGLAALVILGTQFADPAVQTLPGMQISRFRVNDVKPFLLTAVIVLGCAGFTGFRELEGRSRRSRLVWSSAVLASAVALMFAMPRPHGLVEIGTTAITLLMLGASLLTLATARTIPAQRKAPARVTVQIIILAAASGLLFAYATPRPWQTPRLEVERAYYGASVAELLRATQCGDSHERRPSRMAPTTNPTELARSTEALTGAYTCTDAVGGYLNVKNFPTMLQQLEDFSDPTQAPQAFAFYSAPGAVVPTADGRLSDLSDACLQTGACTGLTYHAVDYRPGHLTYRVSSTTAQVVALNESYYPGWSAQLCPTDSDSPCTETVVTPGPHASIALNLPVGERTLTLNYKTPHLGLWWILFGAGTVLSLTGLLLPTRTTYDGYPADPDGEGLR